MFRVMNQNRDEIFAVDGIKYVSLGSRHIIGFKREEDANGSSFETLGEYSTKALAMRVLKECLEKTNYCLPLEYKKDDTITVDIFSKDCLNHIEIPNPLDGLLEGDIFYPNDSRNNDRRMELEKTIFRFTHKLSTPGKAAYISDSNFFITRKDK